ncbi:MAG: formate dehydrogenase accessory sulfurtransferase FdhD [Phycisphaerae bacterium]|nr:formate dehydrogenase accessory sulfurtransferase FdhD [Phycisphaerae bacterium]
MVAGVGKSTSPAGRADAISQASARDTPQSYQPPTHNQAIVAPKQLNNRPKDENIPPEKNMNPNNQKNNTTSQYPMQQFQSTGPAEPAKLNDTIVTEVSLELNVNDGAFTRTVCALPQNLDALGIGTLLTDSNLQLQSPQDIISIQTPPAAEKILIRGNFSSGNRKQPAKLSSGAVPASYLFQLADDLQNSCHLWGQTGCVHATALSDGQKSMLFIEDVARYNAFDKLIGKAFLEGVTLSDKFLIMMGRLTGGIVKRAAAVGLGMLVSRSAVTSLAIDLGKQHNITIVGFLRGNRMNVYNEGNWKIGGEG